MPSTPCCNDLCAIRRKDSNMAYWLMKSEPDVFSFDDLKAVKSEPWNGVRNHLAAQHMRAMKCGDLAFFYHSNIGKEIVGIMEIVREAYPDPSDESGKFVMVDVSYREQLAQKITLAQIKADKNLADMALIRLSRLSVGPVTQREWDHIISLSRK